MVHSACLMHWALLLQAFSGAHFYSWIESVGFITVQVRKASHQWHTHCTKRTTTSQKRKKKIFFLRYTNVSYSQAHAFTHVMCLSLWRTRNLPNENFVS
uniref:Putative secreted protein salivary gland overexpressed n=1 Tax=Rhipicephalus microplus TaxID=6941 RepID=A0A6M2D9V9_RHIMP